MFNDLFDEHIVHGAIGIVVKTPNGMFMSACYIFDFYHCQETALPKLLFVLLLNKHDVDRKLGL